MKIKKNSMYLVAILFLVIGGGYFMIGNTNATITGNVIGTNGEVQNVKLYVENGDYVLEPSELKKDVLVRLEADMSKLQGCSRAIVIPAFGVSKSLSSSDNIIEFVPDKAGTFNIACSMNMYLGTFEVLESDGSKSKYAEEKLSGTNSCGSSGSCGCGG